MGLHPRRRRIVGRRDPHHGGVGKTGWPAVLLGEPAIWTVPLAFLTMVFVSLATPRALPHDVTQKLLALHLPERVRPPLARRAGAEPRVDTGRSQTTQPNSATFVTWIMSFDIRRCLRATLSDASDRMRRPSGWPLGGVAGPLPCFGPATTGAEAPCLRTGRSTPDGALPAAPPRAPERPRASPRRCRCRTARTPEHRDRC